jgi:hypothetical protein
MAHAAARAKPAFVRVLNLSGCQVAIMDRGRPITSVSEDPPISSFAAIPSGSAKVSIKGPCINVPYASDMKPLEAATLIVGPGGTPLTPVAAYRQPTDSANFQAVFVDSTGAVPVSPPAVTLKGPIGSVQLSTGKSQQLLSQGSWDVVSASLDSPVKFTVKAKESYTLFLVQQKNGKLHPGFVDNTPMSKPVSQGAGKS